MTGTGVDARLRRCPEQHDIQKTRFIKNLKRGRPACEATAQGCTPEQMERWAGIS